jgi:DNA-binding LacI/PurR family transcriptional regulator
MNTVVSKRIRVKDIARQIRNEISRKCLEDGSKVISARALAAKLKISVLTANRALDILSKEDILYRVHGSGTFVKGNQFSNSIVIGIADTPDSQDAPWRYATHGIFLDSCLTQLSKADFKIKYLSYEDFCELGSIPSLLNSIDGLIISAAYLDKKTINIFKNYKGVLTFYRNEYFIDIPCNQVIPNLKTGFSEVFNRISPDEYEGIIIIGANYANANARCSQFFKQALEAGFKKDDILEKNISMLPHLDVHNQSYQAVKKICKSFKGKLVFCASDLIAFGLIDAAKENGIKPGKDFALISYDNLEEYGMHPFSEPFLTTIDYPKKEIALKAVELTIDAVRQGENYHHTIKVPTHLIVRKTGLKTNKRRL